MVTVVVPGVALVFEVGSEVCLGDDVDGQLHHGLVQGHPVPVPPLLDPMLDYFRHLTKHGRAASEAEQISQQLIASLSEIRN